MWNKSGLELSGLRTAWARAPETEPYRTVCVRSSDTVPAQPGPGTRHLEHCPIPLFGAGQGSGASCCTFGGPNVAVELANKSIPVLCCPVGQVVDELLDLLPVSVFQSLGAAEVDGVGLDQDGIKVVLADQLAEPIAE